MYKEPGGRERNGDMDVYDNPNCYMFIRSTNRNESCIDTQHECEQVGGNITVINSKDEYDQLTDNVLRILKRLRHPSTSIFNVYADKEYPEKNLYAGCANVVVENRMGVQNDIYIRNKGCFTEEINTMVCESSDLDLGICTVSTTDTTNTQLTSLMTTTSSDMTSASMSLSMSTTPSDPIPTSEVPSKTSNIYPIGVTGPTTDYSEVTYPDGDNQNLNTDPDLLVTVGIPVLVFAVGVIVTFTCCIRYRRSKHQDIQENVSYSNGATIHEHSTSDNQHPCEVENILYDTGIQHNYNQQQVMCKMH
ncbi:uncharacterized protein [Antedon mediterranea]|uniref:uncharacterized protein isoform X2 n=1 Tax=Antedon mediterranea TaxID=105859 RepID=UPI003AF9BA8F